MSSGTEIIHDALKKIGAYSVVQKPQKESISQAKNTLNSMLQDWLSRNIDMGVSPLNAPGDELGEPLDARNGIVANLAVWLAPDFGREIPPTLARNARVGYRSIAKLYQKIEIPKKKVSSTLPLGAGNTKRASSQTFSGKGKAVGN